MAIGIGLGVGVGVGVGVGLGIGGGLIGGALKLRGCMMKKMLGCLFGGEKSCCQGHKKECCPCSKGCGSAGGSVGISARSCQRGASFGFGMSMQMG
jgi:hypothetical protein